MNMLDDILQDIPKDSCLGKAVTAGYNVLFEAETQKGPGVPQVERIDSDSVRIGDQIWMSHNLQMPADPENGIYVENGETYFTWNAAMKAASSYGNGWRLPSREDLKKLSDFCGGDSVAGQHLKSTSGWSNGQYNENGDDTYGFNAIPAGECSPYRYQGKILSTKIYGNKLKFAGERAYIWSSTQESPKYAYYRGLGCWDATFDEYSGDKDSSGYSVRLVKSA